MPFWGVEDEEEEDEEDDEEDEERDWGFCFAVVVAAAAAPVFGFVEVVGRCVGLELARSAGYWGVRRGRVEAACS